MSYSWQYSKILKASATLPNSKGQEIDHIPHHLYNAGVSYKATPSLQLTADARAAQAEAAKDKRPIQKYLIEKKLVNHLQMAAAFSLEFGLPLFDRQGRTDSAAGRLIADAQLAATRTDFLEVRLQLLDEVIARGDRHHRHAHGRGL